MSKLSDRNRSRRAPARIDQLEGRLLLANSYPFVNAVDNDVAYAANGNVYTAWYEQQTSGGVLKTAKRTSSGWTDLGTVPLPSGITSTDFGEYVSIATDSSSNPSVVFADTTNGDLDFAHYNGSAWTNAIQVESSAAIYPSLQFDTGTTWGVSYYYNNTHKDMRFAAIDASTGTVNKTDLDTTGDVGRSSSLQVDPTTGNFDVAYEFSDPTSVASQVRYRAQDSLGNWGTIQTIDADTDGGGGYISMAFDAGNYNHPAVSYYIASVTGSTRYGLMFARQNLAGTWDTAASLRTAKSVYTNLMWDTYSNRFNIIYYDDSTTTVSRFYGDYGTWSTRKVLYSGGGRFIHAVPSSSGNYISTFVASGQNYMYLNDTNQLWGMTTLTQGTPAFPGRAYAGSVTFGGKIYELGGNNTSGSPTNTVIYTSTGATWTTATTSTVFSARAGLGAVVATVSGQQRMYAIGGNTSSGLASDVWYSTDGINWTEATAGQDPALRFTPRQNMGVLYFNNKIWVVGGYDASGDNNDVWDSSDGGVTWTNATASSTSMFPARSGMALYAQTNQSTPKMYVVAGMTHAGGGTGTVLNDSWSSTDGVNWTQETAATNFFGRGGSTSLFAEGRMWLLGGMYDGNYVTDIWWSIDGKNWTQAPTSLQAGRAYAGAGILGNKMFAFGGVTNTGGTILSDVVDVGMD